MSGFNTQFLKNNYRSFLDKKRALGIRTAMLFVYVIKTLN